MKTEAESSKMPPRKRKKQSGIGRFFKFVLTLFLVALVAIVGYAGYLYFELNQAIDQASSGNAGQPERTAPVPAGKPMTILLLGTDTRQETGSLNTDVIMVATLNPERKSATLVSIPRDTYIKMSGYRSGKVNAVYANLYSSDKRTADQKTKEFFGRYLNVDIDQIAKVDFKGFEEIIDKMGPLTIDVDMNMCYVDKYDGTNINLKKGVQSLNGKETLDFVRYRKSNCRGAAETAESNDIDRNARQQQVINEMAGKLKSFGGILKLGPIIDAIGRNVRTDIASSSIKNLMGTYIGIDRDKINYIHLEGKWDSPYIIMGTDELKKAQAALQQQLK